MQFPRAQESALCVVGTRASRSAIGRRRSRSRKIASKPKSISGFTLCLRSMKVGVELVVDRMWKELERR